MQEEGEEGRMGSETKGQRVLGTGDRQSDEAGSGGFKLKFQITVRER